MGAALAKKLNNDDHSVYVLMGDGEQQEGQIWEAALYAPYNKVDNLIATIDYNGQQIDGETADVLSLGNLRAKWEEIGWDVMEMNGNVIREVLKGLVESKSRQGK